MGSDMSVNYLADQSDFLHQDESKDQASIPGIIVAVISVPIFLLTVAGNSLVILAWIRQQSFRTPSNAYLLSLAVADVITGLFCIPVFAHYAVVGTWTWGSSFCKMTLVLSYGLICVSSFHLVAIALDRYRTLKEGISYLQRRSYRSVSLKLGIVWMIGLWVSSPIVNDWKTIVQDPVEVTGCYGKAVPYWIFHHWTATYWFPAIALIWMYGRIYLEIRKRLRGKLDGGIVDESPRNKWHLSLFLINSVRNISNVTEILKERDIKTLSQDACAKEEQMLLKERQSLITVGIVTGAFVLCWLPWTIIALISFCSPGLKIPGLLISSSGLIGVINSCLNPFIYAARMPDFRLAVKKMFNSTK